LVYFQLLTRLMMICGPPMEKRAIRVHYDWATLFYHLFWGRHIHHGLWDGSESLSQALTNLTETVVREVGLRGSERVLDVGCGTGASAIHLAKTLGCEVTGITLSPVQSRWATLTARWHGVHKQTRFLTADAESVEFPSESFDIVWVLESSEYFFDKPAFIQHVANWLRPGGRAAICVWHAGDDPLDDEARRLLNSVCKDFHYPSLGNSGDYRQWFTDAGLQVERCFNWTDRVAKTWEISVQEAERSRFLWLVRTIARKELPFWDRNQSMLCAYRTGAMNYGCWVASKPG
jgi:tocopherol O-methyltransferase